MEQEIDVRACRMLLHEIGEMCDHASLTGSLGGGERRTVQRYNAVLDKLEKGGVLPTGLFAALEENATYGEIGAEARMLASYCRRDEKQKMKDREDNDTDRSVLMRLAPFVRKEELGMLIREHRQQGQHMDMNTLTHLAPFLGQDVLSDLLREHLGKAAARPAPPAAPATPAPRPEPAPRPDITPVVVPETPTVGSGRITTGEESMDELLDLLKSPYLSEDDRNEIVERLRSAPRG